MGSVSVACLSCHDGTQAMDNIINAPGSGDYDVTGGGADGRDYTWPGTRVTPPAADQLYRARDARHRPEQRPPDRHQVLRWRSVQYRARDGLHGPGLRAPISAMINGNTVCWVDTTGGTAARNKTDMQLYTRTFTTGNRPSVECGSCHDPHAAPASQPRRLPSSGATFLRVANTDSAVCLACHVK